MDDRALLKMYKNMVAELRAQLVDAETRGRTSSMISMQLFTLKVIVFRYLIIVTLKGISHEVEGDDYDAGDGESEGKVFIELY